MRPSEVVAIRTVEALTFLPLNCGRHLIEVIGFDSEFDDGDWTKVVDSLPVNGL
jgi:hypothetical protein